MPTVLPSLKGWRVVIYPNDHRPPHVHIIGAAEEARFELLCDWGQVKLITNFGFSQNQLNQIQNYLLLNLTHLCNEWGRIHGHA